MIRYLPHVRSDKGFTLIEIIVTLMLVAITAAIMFPVLGTNLIKSPVPIIRVNNQYQLIEEMDKITGRYRDEIKKDGSDFSINSFKTTFVDTNSNIDAANTQFITLSDNGGTYTTTSDKILMVTLKIGGQSLSSLFAE